MMNLLIVLANIVGLMTLASAIFALAPMVIASGHRTFGMKTFSWQEMRWGLLSAISLGLIHGLLMTQQEQIDFYNVQTYWIYGIGLFGFNLLVWMSFMWSELKRNYQALLYMSWLAVCLLTLHVSTNLIGSW